MVQAQSHQVCRRSRHVGTGLPRWTVCMEQMARGTPAHGRREDLEGKVRRLQSWYKGIWLTTHQPPTPLRTEPGGLHLHGARLTPYRTRRDHRCTPGRRHYQRVATSTIREDGKKRWAIRSSFLRVPIGPCQYNRRLGQHVQLPDWQLYPCQSDG